MMNRMLKKIILSPANVLYRVCPKTVIKVLFLVKNGYRLNLENPITFNEKLQWIKFYDRNPLMPKCSDKYMVRKYVEQCGCGELLNDLLWEGFDPNEIPYETLPKKFVIKVTHGCGYNIICKDKGSLDVSKCNRQLKRWLKEKYLPCYGEWFYNEMPPRIIVEKYLEDKVNEVPVDYKVFCFEGIPKFIDVHTGRFTGKHYRNIYDTEWNLLEYAKIKFCISSQLISKPLNLDQMLQYAERLSKPFKHVRVDFYLLEEKVYFGEMTFVNGAGFDKIHPFEFDRLLGKYITTGR